MKYDDVYFVYDFIGKNIKKYRKKAGLSRRDLSDATFYSEKVIANIENKTRQTFSIDMLWKIANALGVDMYKLCIPPEDGEETEEDDGFEYVF